MVWGGLSWRYRTPLVIIEGNLTSRRYIDEVLELVVVPLLQNYADVTLYQQDNASPHSARLTKYFLFFWTKKMCMFYLGWNSFLI